MAMHGSHNRGIWHAVVKFGQKTLCGRRAIMACELVNFRDGREQCKRCAAKVADMDARAEKKKMVRTIDITPTWTGVLPLYLAALCDGTDTAKAAARDELYRMARLADVARRSANN